MWKLQYALDMSTSSDPLESPDHVDAAVIEALDAWVCVCVCDWCRLDIM